MFCTGEEWRLPQLWFHVKLLPLENMFRTRPVALASTGWWTFQNTTTQYSITQKIGAKRSCQITFCCYLPKIIWVLKERIKGSYYNIHTCSNRKLLSISRCTRSFPAVITKMGWWGSILVCNCIYSFNIKIESRVNFVINEMVPANIYSNC